MRRKRNHQEDIEELLAESQRLRDEMLRTSARLDVFAAVLATTVTQLRKLSTGDDRTEGSC